MSSNRRTAFARVPRGKSSNQKESDKITINKDFLDRITQARIAPDMATVLTKASAELSISVQPNGKGNFTINSLGRVIGDSQDVQKVQSLGTFVNDERKAIVKTSVSAVAKKTIAGIVQVSRDPAFVDMVPRPITRIDKGFVDIYRTVSAQAAMLDTNVTQINNLEPEGVANVMVKNHLIETAVRTRMALGKYLFYRAGLPEGEEAVKLNDFLTAEAIMSWVFTRLCAQKLQLSGKDFEFRKVYFPKDPTKGLQVTFKEFSSANLRDNQGGVLVGMSVFRGLWADGQVRTLCGIPPEWNLDTFEDNAKVLANVPIMVVPFPQSVTNEEHFSVLAQNGDRGLPWSVGNTSSPQDILKFLGTIPKRIAYGFFGRARFSAPWYENLFTGFRFDAAVTDRDGRSVFNQLLTQFRAGTILTHFFATVRGENGYDACRAILPPLVLAVADIPPDSDLGRATLAAVQEGLLAIPNGETAVAQDAWAAITARRTMSDETCAEILNGILATNLDPRSKDAKTSDIRTARSGLSAQGGVLTRELRRRGYVALSSRIDQWLRSFLTQELQAPVAEVILARLEASLQTPVQFNRGDLAVFIESAEFNEDNDPVGSEAAEDIGADNPDDA